MCETPADRLLNLFDRLRKLAFDQNPLEESGVTMPQLTLLDWVAASPGCGVQDIAAGLDLTSPTVSVAVRRLEMRGLMERRPDPQDGRAIQLFLTGRGQKLQGRAHTFRREKMQRLLDGLTANEALTLQNLLEKAIRAAEPTKYPSQGYPITR
ncbi:MAG: winged helix-turn-helix transcriptional regulator [Anaerolineae bacterium]|nr:winged helix-turn-helix transcriptional regulator [Anaerolineae bacterium]